MYIKSNKKDSGGVAPLKKDGILHSLSKAKAEILSDQFSSVFTRDQLDPIPTIHGDPYPNIQELRVTEAGVTKLLQNLVTTKASGPDEIPNRILKELASEISPLLTALFNQSLNTGQHPKDWKTANISPIYKKDDRHTASNYRPVSLTCVCSKLLEHIVVSLVLGHSDQYNIINPLQHGFRRKHSTVTQLLLTTADLAKYHDENKQVDIGILDFSKAFDLVSHCKLLAKLQHYGIRGKLLSWIEAFFLVGRSQRVLVDGVVSKYSPVLSGVPQGDRKSVV